MRQRPRARVGAIDWAPPRRGTLARRVLAAAAARRQPHQPARARGRADLRGDVRDPDPARRAVGGGGDGGVVGGVAVVAGARGRGQTPRPRGRGIPGGGRRGVCPRSCGPARRPRLRARRRARPRAPAPRDPGARRRPARDRRPDRRAAAERRGGGRGRRPARARDALRAQRPARPAGPDLVGPDRPARVGLAAIGVNNLPAAVLLSATPPPHPRALLLGLNLGPNLAVSGSLSAYLWFKAARGAGADPSALRFTRIGAPMAIVAMLAGLATIALVGPS
jgi:hypothetical protein